MGLRLKLLRFYEFRKTYYYYRRRLEFEVIKLKIGNLKDIFLKDKVGETSYLELS